MAGWLRRTEFMTKREKPTPTTAIARRSSESIRLAPALGVALVIISMTASELPSEASLSISFIVFVSTPVRRRESQPMSAVSSV